MSISSIKLLSPDLPEVRSTKQDFEFCCPTSQWWHPHKAIDSGPADAGTSRKRAMALRQQPSATGGHTHVQPQTKCCSPGCKDVLRPRTATESIVSQPVASSKSLLSTQSWLVYTPGLKPLGMCGWETGSVTPDVTTNADGLSCLRMFKTLLKDGSVLAAHHCRPTKNILTSSLSPAALPGSALRKTAVRGSRCATVSSVVPSVCK